MSISDHISRTIATLSEMVKFTKAHFTKINKKKTKVLVFSPCRGGLDFQPQMKLNGEVHEVLQQIRLMGLILTDNLSWRSNTDMLVKRVYAKLWIIRRLNVMGTSRITLRLIYF